MKHLVQTLKWVFAVRGIITILFGLAFLFLPNPTLTILILIFGITVLVDGFINAVGSFQSRKEVTDWWVYLLEGAFSIILGSITIFWPNISPAALMFIISSWAIVTGISKMVAAIGLRKYIEGELVLLFSGILSVIFGFAMITFPQATATAFAPIIGFFSILLGVFLLALAWRIQEEHDPVLGDFLRPKYQPIPKNVEEEEIEEEVLVKPAKPKSTTQKSTATTKKDSKKTSPKK